MGGHTGRQKTEKRWTKWKGKILNNPHFLLPRDNLNQLITKILTYLSMHRTHTAGELDASHIGQTVTLSGWVANRRDHGGLIFIDLRDRYGITQTVYDPTENAEAHTIADTFRSEYVVKLTGIVRARPA